MPEVASSINSQQLAQVLEVSRMLAVTTELDPLLHRIANACCAMLGCERSSIFLHDPAADQLWTKVALQAQKEIRIPSNVGIAGHVFQSNAVYNCAKPYDDPRFNREPDRVSGFVTRNLLAAPMVDVEHRPVGVIQAINKREWGGFTLADSTLIQLLADQAGVAIQRYQLQQAALDGVALRREMELAKEIQKDLIPAEPPKILGIDCVGWTQAASITGGDCYDLWQLADGRLGIFLADASGHGIGPALVVSQARALVRAMCDIEPDPARLLTLVNRRLWEDLEMGRFVTAFVGMLDPTCGELRWSSAGHGPILVRREHCGKVEALDPNSPPLGILEQLQPDHLEPSRLAEGGSIYVISDGVFEALSPQKEQFNVKGVVDAIADSGGCAREVLERIRSSLKRWQQTGELLDDQTVVIATIRR